MRDKLFVLIIVAFMAVTTAYTGIFAAIEDTGFEDIAADSWYQEAIEYVTNEGLITGVTDTAFAPNLPIDRATLVTALWRFDGAQTVTEAITFEDVKSNDWYTEAIRWGRSQKSSAGITPILLA